ncbi:MAG: RNA recognition motif domain-containing protein [Planctomycetota bacterium]
MLNIYVGNLSFDTGETELEGLFKQYGEVNRASVITDRDTGRSRGFGFVEMPNENDGRAAIEALNGQEFGGRHLTVNEAKPRAQHAGGRQRDRW